MNFTGSNDVIIAPITPQGVGAVSVIRLSGKGSIDIVNQFFIGKDLTLQRGSTIHYGEIVDINGKVIDEVLVSLFREPNSYTKEDSVEISCHGSPYIVETIINVISDQGVNLAKPGEFTQRAYLNGRFDLAQAEAVADTIHAQSEADHSIALNQLKGGFSNKLSVLRNKMIDFISLLELELDFTEEDLKFASRDDLLKLLTDLDNIITPLIDGFYYGNAIKNGISISIIGRPNAGKSTLLNTLLQDDKAIVSKIAGTTRDLIEDSLVIEGLKYRFVDTAGLRTTSDEVESIGIQKTYSSIEKADLIIYLLDLTLSDFSYDLEIIDKVRSQGKPCIIVGNKIDLVQELNSTLPEGIHILKISAKLHDHIQELKSKIIEYTKKYKFYESDVLINNVRHYRCLVNAQKNLANAKNEICNEVSSEFIVFSLKRAIDSIGEITGEVTSEEVLSNIFSKFCIGK